MAYADTEKRRRWAREHYAKNPDKVNQVNKVKREKRKTILFEHLGNKCCKCGSTKKLELDHINPLLKTTRQSILSVGLERALEECDNIQLLCKECHTRKSQAQKKAAYYLFYNMPLEEQEKWIEKFIDHKGFIDRSTTFEDMESL
jgi:5-methylcytosine-specific restriction endonuclease McrA